MIRYLMYLDGEKFYDSQIEQLGLINPVLILEDNNAGTLDFTVPRDHPFFGRFTDMRSTIEVYQDEKSDDGWLFTGCLEAPSGLDLRGQETVSVNGALSYFNFSIQRQRQFNNVTPQGYVEVLLANHNDQVESNRRFKLGAITVTDPNDKITCYTNYDNTLSQFKEDIIDDLGGHIKVRKRNNELYLDILETYARTSEQVIEFGENLIEMTQWFEFNDVATCIIPRGGQLEIVIEEQVGELPQYVTIKSVNDDKDYLINETTRAKYGSYWKTVDFPDVYIPLILKEKAIKWLEDTQFEEMIIEAKAFDLHYTDEKIAAFRIGDRVRVKSEPFGIDRYFPVTKLELHLDNVSKNTITLGGTGEPISITDISNNIQITTGKIKEEIHEPNALIEQAKQRVTEEMLAYAKTGHVVYEENEIFIMDTDDTETAKYVWRWNMGGLAFSKNGINGPYETAITMDGTIVGKFLAVNSIATEQISLDYRTKVTDQINRAELLANDYTDSKMLNYYTIGEIEVKFETYNDRILLAAQKNAELYYNAQFAGKYYTKSEIDVKVDSITSTVNQKFSLYSTTVQMNSAIQQKANEITTTVSQNYATKTALGNLETTVKSVESKVTADGIFTTINSGLTGSKSITTTKYSLTKSGITIQGGGITIKNNAGKNVLYADTSGNVTIQGSFYHYNSSGYKAVDIIQNKINFYSWYQSGDYVGSLGAVKNSSGSNSYIELWCDYYDSIVLGYAPSGYKPEGSGYTLNSIMELDRNGVSFIKGTTNGTFTVGKSSITVKNGLITGWSYGSGSYTGGTIQAGAAKMTFTGGMLTNVSYDSTTSGTINIGNGQLKFGQGGVLTSASSPTGVSSTLSFGNYSLTFNRGMMTSATVPSSQLTGYIYMGPDWFYITKGMVTSNSANPTWTGTLILGDGRRLKFTRGVLVSIT